jgi:signal transduction histidine kinase/CheY-like chemotaxis protein
MITRRWYLPRSIVLALVVALVTLAFATYRGLSETRWLLDDTNAVVETHQVREQLDELALSVTDAETGQRGFLLTGDERYLQPYRVAIANISRAIGQLRQLAADNPQQLARIADLQRHVGTKLTELERTIAVRRERGFDAAHAIVLTDVGQRAMEEVRSLVIDMRADEQVLLAERSRQAAAGFRRAVIVEGITSIAGVLLLLAIGLIVNAQLAERQRTTQEIAVQRERADAARIEAERVNVLKDDFLAVLSHELRTPLNAVLGWTQMLRTGALEGPAVARAIAAIDRNATAQQRLVEDLLDVSRIVTGKFHLEKKPMPLAPCIKATVDAMMPVAAEGGITLATHYAGEPIIDGDADRVQQVAVNLLSNALKFTPAGGRVDVSLTGGNGHAVLTVRDTGRGIDGTLLPFIFDRFRQGDSSTTRAHRGLGLGLAIVQHIVQAHGGLVEAMSDGLDRGTTMRVTWPALAVHADAPPGSGTPRHDGPSLEAIVVLLVDDDADSREVGAYVLGLHGAAVTTVASGAEAIARFATVDPHVVVTDLQMPDMDGYSLMRRLAAASAATGESPRPVIALTAHARAQDSAAASAAGFAAYVTKPIQVQALVDAVASAARGRPVRETS